MRDYDENYEWWQETREMVQEEAKYHVDDWLWKNASDIDALTYFFETQGLDPFGLAIVMMENIKHSDRVKALKKEYEKEVEEFLICSDAFHKKMEDMRRGHYDL